MAAKLKITLRRSPIGYEQSQRETARSLGFKKLQQTVVHDGNRIHLHSRTCTANTRH